MQVSQIIGERYELHTRIGQGRMGAVYQAQDMQTGQFVAVKALHEEILSDPSMRERFRREGEALRRLKHPAIVTLLDYVVTETQDYLVLEYMSSGTLREELLRTPQLPLPRLLSLARDLSAALTYAHNSNILHRDIKPGNVLMSEDGTPRLTDFSVAQLGDRTRMTETGVIIGTSAYVSPEIYSNHPADARSDIWSLGIMFYEMLTGELPFQGEHVTAMLLAILSQNPPNILEKRPDAPPALVNLIYMMLLKDPVDRIQTMQRVHDEIVALIQGEPSNLPQLMQTEMPIPTNNSVIQALTSSLRNRRQNLIEDTDSLDNNDSHSAATSQKPKRKEKPRNLWQWMAMGLSAILLLLSGLLAGDLFRASEPPQTPEVDALVAAGVDADDAPNSSLPGAPGGPPDGGGGPPSGSNEPLEILIADFTPPGESPADNPARIIEQNLQSTLGKDRNFEVRFARHPKMITSIGDAERVAVQGDATITIWGSEENGVFQLHIQALPDRLASSAALDKTTLYRLADVTLSVTDVENESLAPYVAGMIALIQLNNGDLYEFARQMTFISNFDGTVAQIARETTASHVHRALQLYSQDTKAAIRELETALTYEEDNALLLTLLAFGQYRTDDINATRRNIDKVREIAPTYSIPLQLDLMLVLISGGNPRPLLGDMITVTRQHPTSGALLLQGLGVYRIDRYLDANHLLHHAASISPDFAYGYPPQMVLALIRGDTRFLRDLIERVRSNVPDAEHSNRILETVFGHTAIDTNINAVSSAAFIYLINGQLQNAIEKTEEAVLLDNGLPVEVYLMQGLAYCNLGDEAAAEAAYTAGLESGSPQLDALYLLRSQVRREQGNIAGADEDIATARQSLGVNPDNWLALVAAFEAGTLNCRSLLFEPAD